MRDVDTVSVEPSRVNGWTCPLHVLQVVAWIVILVFAVIHYTTLVPAIHESWQLTAYIVSLLLIYISFCDIVAHYGILIR